MNEGQQQRFRLGVFIFISLILMAFLAIFFGGITTWFQPHNNYIVTFTDAPGIGVGTPVRRSGVRIGEVSSVNLDSEEGIVLVGLNLERKYLPRTTDDVIISRGLIVGDAAIDFLPKFPHPAEKGEIIPVGTTITGVSPLNARQIVSSATDLLPEAQQTLNQIRASLKKLEEVGPQLQSTLKEFADLGHSAKDLVPMITRSVDDIRDLLSNAAGFGKDFRAITQDVKKIVNTVSISVEDIAKSVKLNEPKFVKAIETTTMTLERIGDTFNDANRKEITKIMQNLQKASNQLEPFLKDGTELVQTVQTTLTDWSKDAKKFFEQAKMDFHQFLQPVQDALADVRGVVGDVRKITQNLAERGGKILQNVEVGTDQIARGVMDFRELLQAFAKGEGTIPKFFSDPTIFNQIADGLAGVNKTIRYLEPIMRDLQVFSDKIARQPELLGVGGAVRPGDRLKESPFAPTPRK